MRTLACFCALTAAALTLPVHAQSEAADPPASGAAQSAQSAQGLPLTVAQLNRMCSPEGTMQYAFGEIGVPGASKIERTLRGGIMAEDSFAMPDSYAPVVSGQHVATDWSNRLVVTHYTVTVAEGDDAEDLMRSIGAIAEEAGWTQINPDPGTTPMYQLIGTGWLSFEKVIQVDGQATKLRLAVDTSMNANVKISCARDDMSKIYWAEYWGNLPEGTPRPVAPQIDVPPALNANRCQHEEIRADMRQRLDDKSYRVPSIGQIQARATYRDRLTTWLMWKLDQSGKVSPEQIVRLAFGPSIYGSPANDPMAAIDNVLKAMPIVEKLSAAQEADDALALCFAFAEFQQWASDMDAATLAQTEAAHSAMEAKARELNISLD